MIIFVKNDQADEALSTLVLASPFVAITTYCTVCIYSLYISMEYPFQGSPNNYQQFSNYTYPMALNNGICPLDAYTLNPYIPTSQPQDFTTEIENSNISELPVSL